VRISGSAKDFPERLMALQLALEAYDRASAAAGALDDATRLRQALDGLFRWMRDKGIDVTEPMEIVGDALGIPPEMRRRRDLVPACVPAYARPKGGGKGGSMSLDLE